MAPQELEAGRLAGECDVDGTERSRTNEEVKGVGDVGVGRIDTEETQANLNEECDHLTEAPC